MACRDKMQAAAQPQCLCNQIQTRTECVTINLPSNMDQVVANPHNTGDVSSSVLGSLNSHLDSKLDLIL